jgi:hypothetical protein
MTIVELEQLLAKHGYTRSRKSINRKLEKLREDNMIGLRSKDTVKRAYKQRGKKSTTSDAPAFDSGGGFDSGWGGESSWDD